MKRPRQPLRALIPSPKILFHLSVAIFAINACQTYAQQQETAHEVKARQDRVLLTVYTSDLTLPYQKLGDLSYTEPLNGETLDSDHINNKLRQMAIGRWGQQVDSIILVTTKVGGDARGQTISVNAEAVRIKDPCPGCRHNFRPTPS
jgi:hypothetical protein